MSTAVVVSDQPKVTHEIQQVHLIIIICLPLLLIIPDCNRIMLIELSQLLWALLLLNNGGVVGHIEHIHSQVTWLVFRVIKHLDRVVAEVADLAAVCGHVLDLLGLV